MSNPLQQFSDTLADVVASAGRNTVRVEARRRLPATGIAWEGGLIITAHHVVEKSEGIKVGLPDGSIVDATLIGRDPSTDLAILRAETGLKGFSFADGEARVGHLVVAIGRPGKQIQAALGMVNQHIHIRQEPALQTDVVMYPGFSGGPLVDASGNLLGMNTSAVANTGGVVIPVATLSRVAAQIAQHGKIKRGFLGVSLQPVRLNDSISALTGQSAGLLIVATEKEGPAEAAGLFQGDIIVTFDGVKVVHLEDLLGMLNGERVGRPVPTQIVRGGQLHEVTVTVGERD